MLKIIIFAAFVALAYAAEFIDYSPNARLLLTFGSNSRNDDNVAYIPSVHFIPSAAYGSNFVSRTNTAGNTNTVRVSAANVANAERLTNANFAKALASRTDNARVNHLPSAVNANYLSNTAALAATATVPRYSTQLASSADNAPRYTTQTASVPNNVANRAYYSYREPATATYANLTAVNAGENAAAAETAAAIAKANAAANARYVSNAIRASNFLSASQAANGGANVENVATAPNSAAGVTYTSNTAAFVPAVSSNEAFLPRYESELISNSVNRVYEASAANSAASQSISYSNAYNFEPATSSSGSNSLTSNAAVAFPSTASQTATAATATANRVSSSRLENDRSIPNPAVLNYSLNVKPTPSGVVSSSRTDNSAKYAADGEVSPGYASELASADNTVNRVFGSGPRVNSNGDSSSQANYDSTADYGANTDFTQNEQPNAYSNTAYYRNERLNVAPSSNANYASSIVRVLPKTPVATPIVENEETSSNLPNAPQIPKNIKNFLSATNRGLSNIPAVTSFSPKPKNLNTDYDSHNLASYVRPPAATPDYGAKLAFNQRQTTSPVISRYR